MLSCPSSNDTCFIVRGFALIKWRRSMASCCRGTGRTHSIKVTQVSGCVSLEVIKLI